MSYVIVKEVCGFKYYLGKDSCTWEGLKDNAKRFDYAEAVSKSNRISNTFIKEFKKK